MGTFVKGEIDVNTNSEKSISLDDQLTPVQKETWQNIKAGFEEFKMIEQGNFKARPVKFLLNEIKKQSSKNYK